MRDLSSQDQIGDALDSKVEIPDGLIALTVDDVEERLDRLLEVLDQLRPSVKKSDSALLDSAIKIVDKLKQDVGEAEFADNEIETLRESGVTCAGPAVEVLIRHALAAGVDPLKIRFDLQSIGGVADGIAEAVRRVDLASWATRDRIWRIENRNGSGVVVLDSGERIALVRGRRVDKAGLRALGLALLRDRRR